MPTMIMLLTKTDLKFSASLSHYFHCLSEYFLWKNLIECDSLLIIGSFCKQGLVSCIVRPVFINKGAFR